MTAADLPLPQAPPPRRPLPALIGYPQDCVPVRTNIGAPLHGRFSLFGYAGVSGGEMQLSNIAARSSGPDISRLTPEVAAHVAILADPPGSSGFDRQLDAYQAVAARWRVAGQGDRAGLASVLTDSPFGQRVHRVLDAFTRAAWPGRDAGPDAAPAQLIKAFDSLSDDDQQIVAGMHTDPSSGAPYASANDYRARLKANLEEAQAPGLERRGDVVTLSPEAQAHLAGKPTPSPASAVSAPRPEMAAAIAAYSARS